MYKHLHICTHTCTCIHTFTHITQIKDKKQKTQIHKHIPGGVQGPSRSGLLERTEQHSPREGLGVFRAPPQGHGQQGTATRNTGRFQGATEATEVDGATECQAFH